MSKSKLLSFVLPVALLCVACPVSGQTVETSILHDTFSASAANAGLELDSNGYRAPTSTQAVWFAGGTSTLAYTQNTSVRVSAGNRGLMAYFVPSTTLAEIQPGETLTATVTFKYTEGSGATGYLRMGFLNSGGNGGITNEGAPITDPPTPAAGARIVADNFSLTSGGNTPRGYSGYVVSTTAANSPTTNTMSFWRRDGGPNRSQQWLGPTSGDVTANTTFSQIGVAGGGSVGPIANNGTVYVAKLAVTYVSAPVSNQEEEVTVRGVTKLDYSVTSGGTTVMSYSVNESADIPFTGFDALVMLSTYNGALEVTDLSIARTSIAPAVVTAPAPQIAAAGTDATFTVAATGAPAPTYQWQKDGVNIDGATAATLTLPNVQTTDAGDYRVLVSNAIGSAISSAASLTVLTVPEITAQPAGAQIFEGQSITIAAGVRGAPTLSYQWSKDGVALANGGSISGATTASLQITAAQLTDAGDYTLVITNSYGTATTEAAALGVYTATPPSIVTQPSSQSVFEGVDVEFTVTAEGPPPFTYRWMKDGVPLADDGRITGSASATLKLGAVRLTDAGNYSLRVTNFADSVTSSSAALTVDAAPVPLAPSALSARFVTESGFTARWNRATHATGYRLDVATDPAFGSYASGYEDVDVGSALSLSVTGLTIDTIYHYRLRAYNSAGVSGNSNVITVTVQPATAPTITSGASAIFTVGVPGSFTITATGVPAPSFSASGLPAWLSLDAATGVLSGTPPAGTAAQQTFTITAQNDKSPNATQAFTVLVQALPAVAEPLTITTLAGQAGSSGSSNGSGATARFNLLAGAGVDAAGNIYVSDTSNHTVRKITPAGGVSTLAGSVGTAGSGDGSGTAASFDTPTGVAVDAAGNVYVADTLNHTIRRISSTGVVTTLAGQAGAAGSADGAGSVARFFGPQGVALDPTGGTLYVADTNNHTLRKITLANGAVTTLAGTAGAAGSADGAGGAARFNAPLDVATDSSGNLYVADTDSSTIRSVTPAGVVSTLSGLAGSSGAADGTGSAARFNHPSALAVDSAFTVYVLDTDNHTVRKVVSALGVTTTIAGQAGTSGSADGLGTEARFSFPTGITVGASGDLFIADTNNHTLRHGALPNFPVITTQPQSQVATVGGTVQFTVTATGRPAVTYQWALNGSAISGATSDTLSVSGITAAHAGDYTVTVSNVLGSVTSNRAGLVVNPVPVPAVAIDGGGGGGAPSAWFYFALALLGSARWAALRRRFLAVRG